MEQKDEDSDEEIPSDTDEETEEKEEKELKVNQLNMPKDRKRNLVSCLTLYPINIKILVRKSAEVCCLLFASHEYHKFKMP